MSSRDALMLAVITQMSLCATVRLDNWLTVRNVSFRTFVVVASLLTAWLQLCKSDDIQARWHRKATNTNSGGTFSRQALQKIIAAMAVLMMALGYVTPHSQC